MGEPSLAERNAAENAAIKMEWESWNASFPPFGLLANIHYVRTPGISSFLITTSEGHILIDTGFETTAPRILMSEAVAASLDGGGMNDCALFRRSSGARLAGMRFDMDAVDRNSPPHI